MPSPPRWRRSRRAGTRSPRCGTTSTFEDGPRPSGSPRTRSRWPPPPTGTAWRRAPAGSCCCYDPDGQEGWTGSFRVVAQVHADVEEEMAADPLLGEVGWSWLTEALDLHAPGYCAPSGTVTRVITEGYGAKDGRAAVDRVRAARLLVPGRRRDRGRFGGDVARLVRPARRRGRPAGAAAGHPGAAGRAGGVGRRRQPRRR